MNISELKPTLIAMIDRTKIIRAIRAFVSNKHNLSTLKGAKNHQKNIQGLSRHQNSSTGQHYLLRVTNQDKSYYHVCNWNNGLESLLVYASFWRVSEFTPLPTDGIYGRAFGRADDSSV